MSKKNKIAIVGVSCRFPGNIYNLDDYWEVLEQGKDVVTEIPDSRWNREIYGHPSRKIPGRSYTWSAGVLNRVDEFDADFFGISRREAEQMDPQQRLLLELTWDAFEDAGMAADKLRGSDCGVFIGIGSNDYSQRKVDDLDSMDAYSMTGNTASIGSNRLSYIFDLQGPSMSIDTACSSSLVALHQACLSIQSGETQMALAGGVNMLLHPLAFVGFSKASMLSPNGRCKAFDASGDGYVRAEGASIVVLKPLEQAEKDGDFIHAVIVSSGVNCDGKTNGITVPSSEGQAKLLNTVYQQSNVNPNDIVYLEAHGTGTSVGDPLESKALSEALAIKRRANNPLLIGSAKTNLGHLEVASGMAGLLKTILCLQKHKIPANLHFKTPNPNIDFAKGNLKVVDKLTEIPERKKPLLMGVNSFGFGGANAHVLLEEYSFKTTKKTNARTEQIPPLFLSAKKDSALIELANEYACLIKQNEHKAYYDIAWSAFFHRQALEQGVGFFADDKESIVNTLDDFVQGKESENFVKGERLKHSSDVALVYSGNGAQWIGMGAVLLKESKLFRTTLKEIDQYWQKYASFSIISELCATKDNSKMQLTEVAQPCLFALQVGITKMLQDLGLKASAAFGHSVGEIAAAWASGALTLEQATHVIYERSFAQALTQGQGKMAAIGLSAEDTKALISKLNIEQSVVVAGINSPKSVTISGDEIFLQHIEDYCLRENLFYRLLDLDYAFHSPYMNPIKERVIEGLENLEPKLTSDISFISTVTGSRLTGTELNAEYWWKNIREPVAFSDATKYLISKDVSIFIEIGSHPVLCRYLEQSLQAEDKEGRAIPTLKRDEESVAKLKASVYQCYLSGAVFDEKKAFPTMGQFVKLPSYPWQREKYWNQLTEHGYGLIERKIDNPLLGYKLKNASASWENQLDTTKMTWLADHEVGGAIVLPAAAYIEMALAASQAWFKTDKQAFEVEEIDISAPIVLEAEHTKTISFNLSAVDGTFNIRSHDFLSNNVTGRLLGTALLQPERMVAIVPALMDAPQRISATEHYELTQSVGLHYGEAFQGVENVWLWGEQRMAWAKLQLPKMLHNDVGRYFLHPSLLDSCFQLLVDIFSDEIKKQQQQAMIPVRVGKLRFYGEYKIPTWCKVTLKRYNPRSVVADFLLLDEEHYVVATLDNVRFKSVNFMRASEHLPASYVYTHKLMPFLNPLDSSPIPEPKILSAAVIASLKAKEPQLKRARHFNEVLPLFDLLVNAYCWEAVSELMGNKTQASINDLVINNRIIDKQLDLLSKILTILREDKLAIYDNEQWRLIKDDDMPTADIIWRTILADYCEYLPELVLMAQCGSHLVDVLRGTIKPYALLRPAKSSIQEHLYGHSCSFGVANLAILEIIQEIISQWPNDRRLRILEVSAGETSITQLLLQNLPKDVCDYVLVDSDEDVIAHAQALYEDYEFVKCQHLDIEKQTDTKFEFLSAASFDIVIAANVVHKSDHLEAILNALRKFLVSSGLLILQERADDRLTDITLGLDPSWWLYDEQTGSTASRLLTPDAWCHLLEEQGFIKAKPILEPEAIDHSGVFIVLANNSQIVADGEAEALTEETWLVLLDNQEQNQSLFQKLEKQLTEKNQQVIVAYAGVTTKNLSKNKWNYNPNDFNSFISQLGKFQHVVYLDALFSNNTDINQISDRCFNLCQFLQAITERSFTLWLITRGGSVYDLCEQQESINPSNAALWGLGRVAMNEYPNLDIRLIDLFFKSTTKVISKQLTEEFLHKDKETEIVFDSTARHVMRMQQFDLHENIKQHHKDIPAIRLDFKVAGSLNNLYWQCLEKTPLLADNQIQIRPLATGLNFRDVMYAMGMLSDEAVENGFAGASLGMELSGVVERVGRGVKGFRVGDEVISFAPASFSTCVITETTATAHKPKEWSHAQAATIPTTFFTVYYALHHLARLQPDEKILIHGAAGGVGLAAIQYAEYIGAEIFATAGTEEKRAFVKMMGADHVMDSRSMAFADEVMELTQGKGVDVVLNSLSGEAIWRNLSILRPFGRFLELGKRDFYENSKIGLRPFRNNISYYGIDADQLLIERKSLAKSLFQEMMQLFDEGILKPLPFRLFPAIQIIEAFRYMQQSRQIGKVVVSFEDLQGLKIHKEKIQTTLKLDEHASYLVTGGLSGFGLKTAQWLVEKGAKHLILLSRSGVNTAETKKAVHTMEEKGVTVYAHAVDVTDEQKMQDLFAELAYCAPTLKGVIHSAAVIDDALIKQLDKEKLSVVLMPKIAGAWNLHRLTEKLDLDFFVMYSSMTTFLGNPGQANYVAANSYLESLAHYRRQKNLPGLYVAWGAIDDVGFLTRNSEVKEALESRIGSKAIKSDIALVMLEKLLQSELTGAAVIDFDWKTIQRFMPAAKTPKYEQALLQAQRLGSDNESSEDLKALIATLSTDEAVNLIVQVLSQEVGKILRLPVDKVDKKKSVFDLGMDSLMGMELAIAIEDRFEVKLPLMTLAEGATISKIASRIAQLLLGDETLDDTQQDALKALYSRHEGEVSTEQATQLLDAIKTSSIRGSND